MPITRQSGAFREIAERVDDLLAGGGASVSEQDVDEEINRRLTRVATRRRVDVTSAIAIIGAYSLIEAAARLAPAEPGRVLCGRCGLQLMGGEGTNTTHDPGVTATFGHSTSRYEQPFHCPCGQRYAVRYDDLRGRRGRAIAAAAPVELTTEDERESAWSTQADWSRRGVIFDGGSRDGSIASIYPAKESIAMSNEIAGEEIVENYSRTASARDGRTVYRYAGPNRGYEDASPRS